MFKSKDFFKDPKFQTEKYRHFENENCYVVACIHENDSSNHSFLVQDIFSTVKIPRLVELISIETKTDRRGKGFCTAFIDKIVREFKDDIIVCAASALQSEYPSTEYTYKGEGTGDKELPLNDILKRLDHFFSKCNFKDVNQFFGSYEFKVSYLYLGNVPGKDLYKIYLDGKHDYEKKEKEFDNLMESTYKDCDYKNDKRDDENAPADGLCKNCYRFTTCLESMCRNMEEKEEDIAS